MRPALSWGVLALLFSFSNLTANAEMFYDGTWSICGTNKMDKMVDLDAKMKAMGHPIGIYSSSMGKCTGTLIDKDLFLTARHCLDECKDISVTFGFLGTESEETFKCKDIVEHGQNEDMNTDYLVIRLEGNPGIGHGWYKLSDQKLTKGQELLMIHHPSATPMKVSRKECAFVEETADGMLKHRCDTEPGSSGSSILVPDYDHPENTRVVGVHAYGGCSSNPKSTNSGPSMRHLVGISSTLRAMTR